MATTPKWRNVPDPKYNYDVVKLVDYYKRAFVEIVARLKVATNGIEIQQSESLLRQIEVILRTLDSSTQSWCTEYVTKAFNNGQATAILSLGDATTLTEALNGVGFSMLAKNTVDALISDTYNDLLLATTNTERKVKQLVRQTVSETMRLRAIQQQGRRVQANDILHTLNRQGLSKTLDSEAWVGIVDKAGRRWNLSTYSDMVVRTKMTQAHIEGVRTETLQRGYDLGVINSHGATDSCGQFEGMIISLNGLTKGYKTFDELKASGLIFHPNCKHYVTPIRDVSLLPPTLQTKNDKAQAHADKVLS